MASIDRELPETFVAGMDYFNKAILPDRDLFAHYEGEHIAVTDQSVIDFDDDPDQLALRVGANYPSLVLYMPHVVRLNPVHPTSDNPEIPDHMIEAGIYYEQVLQRNSSWLQDHLGIRVSIIGRHIVGEETLMPDLMRKVRAIYGNEPIFMTKVTEGPRVEKINTPYELYRRTT